MTADCMAFMGRLLPSDVREVGVDHARAIGLSTGDAYDCIQRMSEQYERDKPYEAQKVSRQYVDLTGHYRLMAALSAAWWEQIGQHERNTHDPAGVSTECLRLRVGRV